MRKLALLLAALFLFGLLGFNFSVANAYDSGCYGNNLYSVMTGRPCYGSDYDYDYDFYRGWDDDEWEDLWDEWEDLDSGDEGDEVEDLQRLLRDEGFYSGSINGVFNSSTRRAWEDFQDEYPDYRDYLDDQNPSPYSYYQNQYPYQTYPYQYQYQNSYQTYPYQYQYQYQYQNPYQTYPYPYQYQYQNSYQTYPYQNPYQVSPLTSGYGSYVYPMAF